MFLEHPKLFATLVPFAHLWLSEQLVKRYDRIGKIFPRQEEK